ncbi:hypothetical protein RV14_GL000385 [Enterococcus ratti]|uniref:Uncharacterized protein n=1 Tax=Enterococcus ratti TaxID=150033 RepID=A0A1L8WIK2_9ENTE|nr:hypothetical protein RV14_GL000385 [Enterococcus ratti]
MLLCCIEEYLIKEANFIQKSGHFKRMTSIYFLAHTLNAKT